MVTHWTGEAQPPTCVPVANGVVGKLDREDHRRIGGGQKDAIAGAIEVDSIHLRCLEVVNRSPTNAAVGRIEDTFTAADPEISVAVDGDGRDLRESRRKGDGNPFRAVVGGQRHALQTSSEK